MSALPADPPPAQGESWPARPKPSGEGWPRRKLLFFIALAAVAHLGFVFIFGTKKQILPRAVGPVPHLQLAVSGDELIALADPTLFVLPHADDFVTAFWARTPAVPANSFRWTEPAQFLPLAADSLGAAFRGFMQTNLFAETPLELKPELKLTEVTLPSAGALPQATTLEISGDLAQRRRLNTIPLPSLPYPDVIAPSKVQALVDTAGNVASVVLLESSAYNSADQQALQLAGKLRFAPAAQVMFGEITFNWHTVPMTATNAP